MWIRKRSQLLFLVVLLLCFSQLSLHGQSSVENNTKTSVSSTKNSVRLQTESSETLTTLDLISQLPKSYQDQLRQKYLEQSKLVERLEEILIEQSNLIEKLKKSSTDSNAKLQTALKKTEELRAELAAARTNQQILSDEIKILTEKLNGFNESVKSELAAREREILTWKIVGGSMIAVSVVAITGAVIIAVRNR